MGYLVHILLALFFMGLADQTATEAAPLPWGLPLLALVPYAVGGLVRRWSIQGKFRRADLGLTFLHASAPFLFLAALFVFGWLGSLEAWTGRRPSLMDWPAPGLFLAFAPFVLLCLLTIDVRARLCAPSSQVSATRRLQARLFLSALAPIALYVSVAWLLGLNRPLRVHIEEVRVWGALFAGLLILSFVRCLPWVLRHTWDTTPLPRGPERELFEAVAAGARFRCRDLILWRTGRQMANAAIVGLFPGSRLVLLTDALLLRLGPRELAAVLAHEIGHAKRGHVLAFGAWAIAFTLGADVLFERLPEGQDLAAGALLAALIGVWVLVFGWLSRRFELDADLYSADLLGESAGMISALEEVGGLHSRNRGSWRHFSTARRVDFLRAVDARPELGRRLRTKLRLWTRVGIALMFASLALEAAGLFDSWGVDRVRANLRLGRYELAAEQLERIADPSEDLERLVRRAASIAGPDDLEAIASAARAALLAGAGEDAADWLALGALRGSAELTAVESALHAGLDEDARDGVLRRLEHGAVDWVAPLTAYFAESQ